MRNQVKNDGEGKDQCSNNKKFGLIKFKVVNTLLSVLDSPHGRDPKLSRGLDKCLLCINVIEVMY